MEKIRLLLWGLSFLIPAGGFFFVRNKIRRFSKDLLGTSDLLKGLKELESENYNSPLSVSGGTNLYLPKIKRNFPDFEFEIVSKKVEQFFFAYFEALEKQSILPLRALENTAAVKSKVEFEIEDMKSLGEKIGLDNIKTNGISIWNYSKSKEVATITFQISLGYRYRKENSAGIEQGVAQAKYSLDMSYLFEDYSADSFSLNCQNCGGPIKDTSTVCEFCGSGLIRNIEMVWRISGFDEIKKYTWKDK